MQIRILTWNLFHGRDKPPGRSLYTWRSRLLRRTERDRTHVQVNRDLYPEFAQTLADADWEVALLQECPPRWSAPLARDCGAEAHRSLTSRNWLLPLTSLAARLNPDLIASWEGGSNLILARPRAGGIAERRTQVMRPGLPERRTMAFTRLGCGLCVASLHASTRPAMAECEVAAAASQALDWASGAPLVLGGDFNLRPRASGVFQTLADVNGLAGITAPDAIDHLLVRGAEVVQPARRWPPEARELPADGRALRLSDHAPVELVVELPG